MDWWWPNFGNRRSVRSPLGQFNLILSQSTFTVPRKVTGSQTLLLQIHHLSLGSWKTGHRARSRVGEPPRAEEAINPEEGSESTSEQGEEVLDGGEVGALQSGESVSCSRASKMWN